MSCVDLQFSRSSQGAIHVILRTRWNRPSSIDPSPDVATDAHREKSPRRGVTDGRMKPFTDCSSEASHISRSCEQSGACCPMAAETWGRERPVPRLRWSLARSGPEGETPSRFRKVCTHTKGLRDGMSRGPRFGQSALRTSDPRSLKRRHWAGNLGTQRECAYRACRGDNSDTRPPARWRRCEPWLVELSTAAQPLVCTD